MKLSKDNDDLVITIPEKKTRTVQSESTLYLSGTVVPMKVLPAAKIYPQQMYWIPCERNIQCEEVKFAHYLPVTEDPIDISCLPTHYDMTYVTPLDSPQLEKHEQVLLSRLREAQITTTLARKIFRCIEEFRDNNMDEELLFRRALIGLIKEVPSTQYRCLVQIMKDVRNHRDSIQRILSLYIDSAQVDRRGKATSILQRPPNEDISECKCDPICHPDSNVSFKNFFFSAKDLERLCTGLEIHGFNYCDLSRFLANSKTCNMIRSLFDRHRVFSLSDVLSSPNTQEETTPEYVGFRRCKHEGNCESSTCPCHVAHQLCTKFCRCPSTCPSRHQGCRCVGECLPPSCQCIASCFECDPVLCHALCNHMSLSIGIPCAVYVKPSNVAGWGCYANEAIPRGQFIMEYTGEIISWAEAERRGYWYDLFKSNFLYDLDPKTVIDGTYSGSAIRFCNHSTNVNAQGEVRWVNGELRIGIFASKDIVPNEEILIDYGKNYVKKQFAHINNGTSKRKRKSSDKKQVR